MNDYEPVIIQGCCPYCELTEDKVWYEPCPSDDCPSHHLDQVNVIVEGAQ